MLLAHTKVGMYTAEEFDAAFGQFQSTQKPFIFTYFKAPSGVIADSSLGAFQQKLHELKHFYSTFQTPDDLWLQFNRELDRLETDGFAEFKPDRAAHGGRTVIQGEKGNAYITYANDRRVPCALTVPPFLPKVFLGREEDLSYIHDRLFSGRSNLLLLVNGVGGIGKTSIAAKYYHEYADKYQHTVWILSEPDITQVLLRLADPLELRFDERQDNAQRLELLLATLANLEKPAY